MARTTFTAAERDFIMAPNFGYIATTRQDGFPHIKCVWVDIEGEFVLINSPAASVKVGNLRRDPRLALLISDRNDPYRRLEVSGRAVEIGFDGARDQIDRLAHKYQGLEVYGRSEVRAIIRIRPSRISAHNF